MKKIIVLVVVTMMFATTAFAGIKNTKHDLYTVAGSTWGSTYTELCVFCHTPHSASTSAQNAPLWNRTYDAAAVTAVYNSVSTTQAVFSLATYNATDAPLCLACHDGSGLTDALVNPPNAGGSNSNVNILGPANLGGDLANDHPIGFNYVAVQALDSEIIATPSGITFFDGIMWCSSCHDVHDNTNVPFLTASNTGSLLCLTCHAK